MAEIRQYSSRHVLIELGNETATALADGTFVSIEPHGEGTSKQVGADGAVAVGLDPDWTASVNLTFMQTSPSAEKLQERYLKEQRTGIIEFFPILIQDLTGTTLFHAEQAWVANMVKREFSKREPSNNIEITIETGDATWEVVQPAHTK
ncbi:MAG: DUF3277 family protein [Firmicutes bacterium]|nr:DUF3277 family protein [Bacillota bacterium]